MGQRVSLFCSTYYGKCGAAVPVLAAPAPADVHLFHVECKVIAKNCHGAYTITIITLGLAFFILRHRRRGAGCAVRPSAGAVS